MARTIKRRKAWTCRRDGEWVDPRAHSRQFVTELARERRERELRRDAERQLAAAGVTRARV